MAAGAVSLTAGFPRQQGNMWLLVGTIELDDIPRGIAITDTNSRLVSLIATDNAGGGNAEVALNTTATSTTPYTASTLAGSIRAFGNHQSTQTYNFIAFYT